MKTVAIALSGGIDSAFSAYLLQKEGYRVLGLHADFGFSPISAMPWLENITSFLKIPLNIFSFKEIFEQNIINYFISEYKNGRTPNPCVVCNPVMKFDLLYQKGLTLGADYFATGHYAQLVSSPIGGGLTIGRGTDKNKDQSYFLHRVRPENLKHFLFPLGTWTKALVKERAKEIGLPINPQGESQDICFLPKGGYREFLLQQNSSSPTRPGEIVDTSGKVLGFHKGLYVYTIGQRRGLGVPGEEPYYVIRLEPDTNRVVIGGKKDLDSTGCSLSDVHLLFQPPDWDGFDLKVQIRYKHKAAKARLILGDNQKAEVCFQHPQSAVTPGQAAVFYWGDCLLGGGWIESSWR